MPAIVRPVGDERDALAAYLAHERQVLIVAAYGLTDEQARLTPTASALSIEGLLTHMTTTERTWASTIAGLAARDRDDSRIAQREHDTLAAVVDDYRQAIGGTDAVVATVADLERVVPVPEGTRWAPRDLDGWSVRWILLHLIHETARHAGHADIIRESIDGATALPLMAAVEQWPPRRTIQPWTAPAPRDGA
jgi:uncharacterized damage-inducible protein DinB